MLKVQMSTMQNTKKAIPLATRPGIMTEKSKQPEMKKHFAQFSGSFTATVEQILPDYYALPGKTVAVVHFFQDRPFLLHFQKDLTGELIEGTAYVFEFETFEVELPDDEKIQIFQIICIQ